VRAGGPLASPPLSMSDSANEEKPPGRVKRARRAMAGVAGRLESNAQLVTLAKFLREFLPGDSEFGDPLSTGGREQAQIAGRRLSAMTAQRPGVLREAGLGALQVWQALSEAQGRGRGERKLAILFTDLVEFSEWALEAGDDAALKLLRDVGEAIEPPVEDHDGEVVKRLGDGMMAVFDDVGDALDAVAEARTRLEQVEAEGYDPQIRAGIHVGHPRHIGGDYLGVDVNVAARVAEEAQGGELLVSDRALDHLGERPVRKLAERELKVKGVPREMCAYVVEPSADGDGAAGSDGGSSG
jgi:adenylate cyclase